MKAKGVNDITDMNLLRELCYKKFWDKPDSPMFVRHKKTGNKYSWGDIFICCTNGQDDRVMVTYTRNAVTFVRDFDEFCEKFEAWV